MRERDSAREKERLERASLKTKMRIPAEKKEGRIILLNKGLKGEPKYPLMTLFQRIGILEINMCWHFRYLQQIQIIYAYLHSIFPRLLEIGMTPTPPPPDSLISSAEMSDDCVSKFTSFVRAQD